MITQLMENDIKRVQNFLENPKNFSNGLAIYIEITSRYDSVIDGFGNGLYSYYPKQHFYDPNISLSTLTHNLQVLKGKMESYVALNSEVSHKVGNNPLGNTLSAYDVFLSHANADKLDCVDQLKQSLEKLRINVFYDKDSLEWGDNWKTKILEGVERAEFAIIIISENFFGREWTERELSEFLNRQNSTGQKIILPIIHNITIGQLQEKYPDVANLQAIDMAKYSYDEIAIKFAGLLIKRLKSFMK